MTFKKTVGSLSFVLAATVSSIALAQGLGAGVNANVGIGSAPVSANVQAGAQTTLDAPAAGNPNASLDSRNETGSGTQGAASAASAALGGTTRALEASGKTAVGTGLDTAAAAQAQAHDAPLKAAKSRKIEHAKKSTRAKADLDAGTQLKAKTN